MKINKKISAYNHTKYSNRPIKYIVIHYVGAVSTAKGNASYFASGNRNASAHYFVDNTSIWQSVEDKNASWNCGGGRQGNTGGSYLGKCTNYNCIGIEMCCYKKDGKIKVSEKTEANTVELVKYLMAKHGIPASNVIRHWDVTGKNCPAYWTGKDNSRWKSFKKKISPVKAKKKTSTATFAKGKVYTLTTSLKVRSTPSIKGKVKKYEDLTDNAKKHCKTKKKGADATLVKGTAVTCQGTKTVTEDKVTRVWMKIPSGYISAKAGKNKNVK